MNLSSQIPDVLAIPIMLILGASAGSFLNAAALRTLAQKKWWGNERSVCDKCGKQLQALDLIPVLSFVMLRGKCRYCKAAIEPVHFYAEVVSAVLTAALYYWWGFCVALPICLVVLWFSLFNSITDLKCGYIYDVWALAPGVIGMLLRIQGGSSALIDGLLGAALGFGVIAAIIIVSRGGMGWGDAMLMAGIGGALGWRYCAMGMYLGFLAGGVVVVPLVLAKKLKRKDAVPLGPFLAAGTILTLFVGNMIQSRLSIFLGESAGWPWG